MRLWLPIVVLLLVLASQSIFTNAVTTCKKDSQCSTTSNVCALCIQGLQPPCSQAICLNEQCGQISPCAFNLTGSCKKDSDCPSLGPSCLTCTIDSVPFCAQPICFNGQCGVIKSCSIKLT